MSEGVDPGRVSEDLGRGEYIFNIFSQIMQYHVLLGKSSTMEADHIKLIRCGLHGNYHELWCLVDRPRWLIISIVLKKAYS